MRSCGYPGCTRKHKALGFCQLHYKRHKNGVPMGGRSKAACGTVNGYNTHRRNGEPPCKECTTAKAEYGRIREASSPPCSVDGCHRGVVARGLCSKHRQRWARNGDPTVNARDPERNFWGRVVLGAVPDYRTDLGECWIWTGKTSVRGYGVFRSTQQYAHRYAYESRVGPIPPGLTIDHLCRVTNCVNPTHLEPVTRAENTRRELKARQETGK